MKASKLLPSPQRFSKLVKRLSKMRPGSAAAKRVRSLSQSELSGILKHSGKTAAERAIRGVKVGSKKLEMIEKKGTLRKWRTPLALGLTAVEIWLLASRARNRTVVKHKAVRAPKKSAKRAAAR
jgi:hypothetical protein